MLQFLFKKLIKILHQLKFNYQNFKIFNWSFTIYLKAFYNLSFYLIFFFLTLHLNYVHLSSNIKSIYSIIEF